MAPYATPNPTVLVIFGGAGDLAHRKLIPALYNLYLDRLMPDRFWILCVDLKETSDEDFRKGLRDGVEAHSRRGKTDDKEWEKFAPLVTYTQADFGNIGLYASLANRLQDQDRKWGVPGERIFYLAIPPSLVEHIVKQLGNVGLARSERRDRIVVEKPFGHDLASAKALNGALTAVFDESQIFRIDHYLGKETVQNILAFRFANSLFEPIWNRRYIDHVQITVAEDVGVEHRGDYYEHAGALRDMVQNHLSQVMCLIAMEPPVSYKADEIRNKKMDVLEAIQPLTHDRVHQFAVRGQYGAGWVEGAKVPAYRREEGVDPKSNVETFAAVKYFVDNWRWQDVPFYLRTGKRLPSRVSEVTIQFNPVPHQSFPSSAIIESQPNRLVIRIQPQEGIMQRFQAKQPGQTMQLRPVEMKFSYEDAFKKQPPEAYETLLLDVMLNDPTQFMRADQLEAAWQIITPILEVWDAVPPSEFPNYAAGTWGPEAAQVLIAQDGRSWFLPPELGNGKDK
jgi:glucose-6-phosphate 1-dehydrogenase